MPISPLDNRPSQTLISSLIDELAELLDLSTTIGDRTLAERMAERLRGLRPSEPPVWGSPGDISQVARLDSGPLDFFYRPHLFPDMDAALRLGHHLQFDLLPRHLPSSSPLRIAAVLESYCHLSGDLLGWRLEEDELFLWIADVSGHGVRAGLAAAALYFLVGNIEIGRPPAEFARLINDSMLAARHSGDQRPLYVTAFWLRVNAEGRGVYASCGHPPILLRRASGAIEELGSTGLPLGLLTDQTYRQVDLRLEPGDGLCLYTDGLVEALNTEDVEFGLDRLAEVLLQSTSSPLETARLIYRAFRQHKDTELLDDDLTFLLAEFGE